MVANPGLKAEQQLPYTGHLLAWMVTPRYGPISPQRFKIRRNKHPGKYWPYIRISEIGKNKCRTYTAYIFSAWGKTLDTNGTNRQPSHSASWMRMKIAAPDNLPLFSRGTNDWEQKIVEFQTGADTSYIYVYANIPGRLWDFLDGWCNSKPKNQHDCQSWLWKRNNSAPELDSCEPVWQRSDMVNISHNGSKSIEINIPGNIDLISGYPESEKISAEPFTNYTFSAWGKTRVQMARIRQPSHSASWMQIRIYCAWQTFPCSVKVQMNGNKK